MKPKLDLRAKIQKKADCSCVKTKKAKNMSETQKIKAENTEFLRELGRIIAGGFYDYQEVRIGIMNRMRDIVRKKAENIPFNAVEEKKEEDNYEEKYTDAEIPKILEKLITDGKMSADESRYITSLLELLKESRKNENKYKNLMDEYIQTEPIFFEFLQYIKGISTILSANMIKNFGYCERYEHISSLWKHVGMHVVEGFAPKREKGKTLDFNPKLRTLVWKISDSFVKQRTPYYREVYDAEKTRLANIGVFETDISNRIKGDLLGEDIGKMKAEARITAANFPKILKLKKGETKIKIMLSKGHIEARARRKMVKLFLSHYWLMARKLKKLPISEPYVIEKLGHSHFTTPEQIVEMSRKKSAGL